MCHSAYQSSSTKIVSVYLKKNEREEEANLSDQDLFSSYHITFYPKALLQWWLELFSVNFIQNVVTHSEILLRRQNSVVIAYILIACFPIWIPCSFTRTFFVKMVNDETPACKVW